MGHRDRRKQPHTAKSIPSQTCAEFGRTAPSIPVNMTEMCFICPFTHSFINKHLCLFRKGWVGLSVPEGLAWKLENVGCSFGWNLRSLRPSGRVLWGVPSPLDSCSFSPAD